jgi:outer membrane protein assembly factor BamB
MKVILNNLEIDDFYRPRSHVRFPLLQKELEFLWPVEEVIEFKNVYVLLLNVVRMRDEKRGYDLYNENVFGISKTTGEIVWQIEPIPHVREDSPYVYLGKEEDKVIVGNWDGDMLTIDPETGKILKKEFTK